MARRKNNLTITEQLQEVTIAIQESEKQLFDLKNKKRELEKAKKEEEVKILIDKITEKGMTVEEATKIFDNIEKYSPNNEIN
ncbi:unknown [Firmicutes bacterium CAG:466]|jgi:hypothetical protein|nr:unknown [Firmicutes bacterium CAG:466]